MRKTRVGIIFGGKSAEHEVSLQSARNIIDALDRSRFDATLIGIAKQAAGTCAMRTTSRLIELALQRHAQDRALCSARTLPA